MPDVEVDPRRPDRVRRFKRSDLNSRVDPTSEYMNFFAMALSMMGLMLRMKWASWASLFCCCMAYANARSSEDTKHGFSGFMLASSSILMSYMSNPEPMRSLW
ncbi:PAT complex subunit Asterix-like [Sycon ciliatum]|uniref:PAT complex subunit Asterix-like n=1 Tax=Sycon ciliatum TaxID=27933 RepID=UPI0020ADC16A